MTCKIRRWTAAGLRPQLSVVLTTYNQPEWLEKVLRGYAHQSFEAFELLIADDGSDERTSVLIERIAPKLSFPLVHVWHPDQGFRKSVILNRAIEAVQTDYVVFSDGDCIPRSDFLSVHETLRAPGRFLSGGYCKLSLATSQRIEARHIQEGDFADPLWLRANGSEGAAASRKLHVQGGWAVFWDWMSTARASWNGHNASGWLSDIVAVNGFDERMQYGGQDREFGERLVNIGVRGKRIRHRAVVVHLDHPRGYATAESIARNRLIRAQTRKTRSIWAEQGIHHGPAPLRDHKPIRA